jgi:hypothetical protein
MAEGDQSGVENDNNFIGFASRLDPANLKPGVLQSSRNMRLQRGTAQPRKGCERMTDDTINQNWQSGSGYYVNPAGSGQCGDGVHRRDCLVQHTDKHLHLQVSVSNREILSAK